MAETFFAADENQNLGIRIDDGLMAFFQPGGNSLPQTRSASLCWITVKGGISHRSGHDFHKRGRCRSVRITNTEIHHIHTLIKCCLFGRIDGREQIGRQFIQTSQWKNLSLGAIRR